MLLLGYIGYDENNAFLDKVRKNPYSVILLDEIEKTHPDIMNILLQIFDDGVVTDSQGKKVDFKNTIIVMTSNVGARLITDKNIIGFENKNSGIRDYESIKSDVLKECKRVFKPELLNRIDEIIVFHQLGDNDLKQILEIMINKLKLRLKDKKIELELTESAKKYIIKVGSDYKYGARPLRRTVQNLVEDKLAEKILEYDNFENKKVIIDEKDGNIELEIKTIPQN